MLAMQLVSWNVVVDQFRNHPGSETTRVVLNEGARLVCISHRCLDERFEIHFDYGQWCTTYDDHRGDKISVFDANVAYEQSSEGSGTLLKTVFQFMRGMTAIQMFFNIPNHLFFFLNQKKPEEIHEIESQHIYEVEFPDVQNLLV
jgi:hypothetical protein